MTQHAASATARPLDRLVVVELGHSVAAPYAGQILGDLGATVVKIEKSVGGDDARGWGPPFVEGTSACYLSLNRNKRSVSVDLRDERQVAQVRAFITREADVVLQNLRPGSVDRLGLGASSLRAARPGLIYCNMGAFGRSGPLAARPGYDPLMQACGGIMSVTGEPGRAPVRVGVSIVDMSTGMWAVIGILSALHERSTSGRGCEIDVSLFESALAWMSVHVANHAASGEVPGRLGSGAVITAPYQAFRARDGHIVIAAGNGGLFTKLALALGHPEWSDDARFLSNEDRLRNKETLAGLIDEVLSGDSVANWVDCLENAGVPCAPIQDTAQVVSSAQTRALGMVTDAADRHMRYVGLPILFDGSRPAMRMPPAPLGAHNDEVLGRGSDGNG